MPASVISPKSAVALRRLLSNSRSIIPDQQRGGEQGRVPLLVRCTSATAAGGSGISAECYPAVVVDPVSDELLADQPELGEMWLTLVDGSVPTADAIYQGVLSGEHTEGSDTRPRVFAASGMGGSIIRSWKEPVRAATTVAGTLASSFENGDTIDGVVLATGNRILIKNQASGVENGIYTVNASGAPTRATDADTGSELLGAAVVVTEGTANADTVWLCTTNAPITLGSTNLVWARLGSGITVAENDTIPTVTTVSELRFDQADGFVVSSPGAGIARIDMALASTGQVGVIGTGFQSISGSKTFHSVCAFGSSSGTVGVSIGWGAGSISDQVFEFYNSGTGVLMDVFALHTGGVPGSNYLVFTENTSQVWVVAKSGFAIGVNSSPNFGASGSFTSNDGKTITVAGGIITSIV